MTSPLIPRKRVGSGHRINLEAAEAENMILSVPPFSDELGYPVISRGHGLAKIKVHQLAVWIRDGTFIRHGMNASHMCHRPACASPAHLRAETITLNRLRQGCPCWRWLDTQKTTRVSICTHGDPENGQPFCLRPDIKGRRCLGSDLN